MSRPWKHPKTGFYYFRRGVPADLKTALGREEKVSLKTRDPAEAKRRHAIALTESDARWANLRAGSKVLSEREAHDLAAPYFSHWLHQHRDNPSVALKRLPLEVFDRLWKPLTFTPGLSMEDQARRFLQPDALEASTLSFETECRTATDDLLKRRGLTVDDAGRSRVMRAIAAAFQRATVILDRLDRGEPEGLFEQGAIATPSAPTGREPVKFNALLQGWIKERRPMQKTIYEWSRVLREFEVFVAHDDATRVTAADVVRWKQSMIESNRRPKTIRDAKLAPVRAIFQWGVDNNYLAENPVARVTIDVRAKSGEGRRGFSDHEAATVLGAALQAKDPVRRWVPWLCAYSGARVRGLPTSPRGCGADLRRLVR